MNSTALTAQAPPQQLTEWKSPAAIKSRIAAIQNLMSEVLKPGTKDNEFSGDYGIIPGTGNKPSLWKAGSEQILAMFEIAVEPVVEDLSTDDCFRYRVTTRLTHAPTGQFLGAGVGEASTDETKYKWKRTYNQKEYDSIEFGRKRIKYSRYEDSLGMWVDKEEMQIRTEPADLANTILKMAKKRSQIDATLTVTGASSMFDQDLEDLPEGTKQEREPAKGKGKTKPAAQVKCSECNATGGHLPKCSKRESQQTQDATKQEDVICGKCGKLNGHEDNCVDAKSAAKTEPAKSDAGTETVVAIQSVEEKLKKADKKGFQAPYFVLNVVDREKLEWRMYVWDTKLHPYVKASTGQMLLCRYYSQGKTGDKVYCSLETILELGGVSYKDNKPVDKDDF